MGALLTIAPLWQRWAAIGALVLACAGFCFLKGVQFERGRWDAATAKAEAKNLEEVQRLAKVGEREVVKYITKTKVIHDQIASVPLAVTAKDDADCSIPADFSRLWNSANRASSSSPVSPDAAAGPAFQFDAQGKPQTIGH